MLILVVDNSESDTSFKSDVCVIDHRQLPAATSCNPKFETWITAAAIGDVYQIGISYHIVKLGAVTG